jgi:hypothetical protein
LIEKGRGAADGAGPPAPEKEFPEDGEDRPSFGIVAREEGDIIRTIMGWAAVNMNAFLLYLRKYPNVAVFVIAVCVVELLLSLAWHPILFFAQWNDVGTPPSEAVSVIEYGYVKSRDGNIYKNYSEIEPGGGWKNKWLIAEEIDEYLAYDKDVSTCDIPEIDAVKSIVLRCRKLINYKKTYAMAIGNDGRVYEYMNSSIREMRTVAILFFVYFALPPAAGGLLLLGVNGAKCMLGRRAVDGADRLKGKPCPTSGWS